jgi:hypothetical protein
MSFVQTKVKPLTMWTIMMLIPVIMRQSSSWDYGSTVVPLIFYTLLYPFLLSTFSLSPSFQLTENLVLKASIVTFAVWLFLSQREQVREDIENPENNPLSWLTYVGIIATFLAVIVAIGSFDGKNFLPYNAYRG